MSFCVGSRERKRDFSYSKNQKEFEFSTKIIKSGDLWKRRRLLEKRIIERKVKECLDHCNSVCEFDV